MSQTRLDRRLSAVLAADVAGYSRLIGLDEEGTVSALKAHRTALFEPRIAHHRGRLVKTTGDGLLVEFPSVVDAVRCAVDVQREMARRNGEIAPDRRIEFRIGIHVGDIVAEQDDIFGDGVNVAARLEALAEPGGISVSARVQEDAEGRLDVAFVDDGQHQLKNIARPVRVYRVQLAPAAAGTAPRRAAAVAGTVVAAPPMPASELPSIAVMPFQNLTSEPDQDYFADGVVDDIINGLSRYRTLLFVIARNSTFTYKGRAVDVKQVGRELNVRYVLEGSVRRAGNRLRIGGQLIDATTAVQIWSDRFEGEIEDIFALQDRVAESVVGALVPQVREAEMNRARRTPTESVDSHLAYMQALGFFHTWSRDGLEKALQLCYRAIELDPNYATPYGLALNCFCLRRTAGWVADRAHDNAEARRFCDRVLEIGRDNFLAVASSGFAMASLFGECEQGARPDRRIAQAQPQCIGDPGAERLCPDLAGRAGARDPPAAARHAQQPGRRADVFHAYGHGAGALRGRARRGGLCLGGEGAAAQSSRLTRHPHRRGQRRAARPPPGWTKYLSLLRQLDPGLLLSNLADRVNLSRPKDRERLAEGLRKAGLPE